ncbi:Acetyltransferase (GNAT) domain-containing protein [Methylobacillus rhizosphaerae]|uniref:Acetyltransferase (GNAT) domain-containing protein n=2 Tax=Methylobacillus rhizosphaerae TaxID=551994 RepID=A0A238YQW8_9PROT|nr:Acetyltransferase (GNAT) domain-containing protein [Methylobacillus rhizosphaerae]
MLATPNLGELFSEYASEAAIPDLGAPIVHYDSYRTMESAGLLHIFAAFDGDHLIGFLVMIASIYPHFGKLLASTESYFVSKSHRHTGAGLKLMAIAEQKARELGAIGFYVSAPLNGVLDRLIERKGFNLTNRVFFKSFSNSGDSHV